MRNSGRHEWSRTDANASAGGAPEARSWAGRPAMICGHSSPFAAQPAHAEKVRRNEVIYEKIGKGRARNKHIGCVIGESIKKIESHNSFFSNKLWLCL